VRLGTACLNFGPVPVATKVTPSRVTEKLPMRTLDSELMALIKPDAPSSDAPIDPVREGMTNWAEMTAVAPSRLDEIAPKNVPGGATAPMTTEPTSLSVGRLDGHECPR
jgi:hypothetical protein